ncbi:MAG: protease modulator HflC [Alphaproteobacteria bacterium]|nr:protease modulator HflC [Alphaproteobacteria bacterium]
MNRAFAIIAIVVIALGFVAMSALYTVHQTEQALVLEFGKPVRVVNEPGLKFKKPFIQNVVKYDRRVLDLDPSAEEMIASDKKRIVADAYARYKITDPLKFFQSVATEAGLRVRLGRIINASMRSVIGGYSLPQLLTEQRVKIMAEIQDRVNGEAKQFGIQVIDVRIRRADLPQENSEAIYARMKSEREREAKEARAEGAEIGQRIRAEAERDRTVLLAEARKRAEELRGEGDGLATSIANKAYGGEARPFYEFYRSMQAYKEGLLTGQSTFVLSPDSDFFRFLTDFEGKKRLPPSR